MMRIMDTTAQRLDALMDRRRLDLGHKWKAIAENAGVTYQTLGQLRKGKPVAPVTVARVERALQWDSGSIRAILDGGEPTPMETAGGAEPLTEPVLAWDGELVGVEPLLEDEELRWRDGRGRLFQYRVRGFEHEATMDLGTAPEEAILVLRRQMLQRIHRVTGLMMDRPQKAPDGS